MAIHTLEQLEAALTTDLKWRLQEMFVYENLTRSARPHVQRGLLRGGLALVYAHWEGYVKYAGAAYLEYVSRKGLHLAELRPELAAVALRSDIVKLATENSSQSHTKLVEMLWQRGDHVAKIPYDRTTIRTRANLNFQVFDSIMHSLGCDASRHQTYELLIDERLLGSRNSVAHGQYQSVSLDDWKDTRDAVELILKDIRTQISNAAVLGSFRAPIT